MFMICVLVLLKHIGVQQGSGGDISHSLTAKQLVEHGGQHTGAGAAHHYHFTLQNCPRRNVTCGHEASSRDLSSLDLSRSWHFAPVPKRGLHSADGSHELAQLRRLE